MLSVQSVQCSSESRYIQDFSSKIVQVSEEKVDIHAEAKEPLHPLQQIQASSLRGRKNSCSSEPKKAHEVEELLRPKPIVVDHKKNGSSPEDYLVLSPPPYAEEVSVPIQPQSSLEFMGLFRELRTRLDQEKLRMEQLNDIFHMGAEYDQENDEIVDNPNPDLQRVQEQFNTWAAKIRVRADKAKEVIKSVSYITPLMTQLDSNILSPETIYKIRFVHKEASLEIEKNHKEMVSKKIELERDLVEIQRISKDALNELKRIKQHPHFRRSQMIGRISRGEKLGTVSNLSDRATRHFWSMTETACDYYTSIFGSRAPSN